MRLSTIHQVVIGGAGVGAGLLCLYAGLLARRGMASTWGLLAVAAGFCALGLALYLVRFRRSHRGGHPEH